MLKKNGGGAGKSSKGKKNSLRRETGRGRLHYFYQPEVWRVTRMPDRSSAWGGQQHLQLEIRRANETQWFVLEAASRIFATLCLPASSSAPPQTLPPAPSQSGRLGCMRDANLSITSPCLAAQSQHSVCLSERRTGCSMCSPGRRHKHLRRQGGWELLRLRRDFAPGWPGHQA